MTFAPHKAYASEFGIENEPLTGLSPVRAQTKVVFIRSLNYAVLQGMNTLRKFTFRNLDWECTVELFPDRLEYFWDLGGFGKEGGRRIYLREDLAPQMSEGTGARSGWIPAMRNAGAYLILAVFSYVLMPMPWRYLSLVFVLICAVAAYRGAKLLRRSDWIAVLKKDLSIAVSLFVTKWSSDERKDFRDAYSEWIRQPNQRSQRNTLDLT